MPSHHHHHIHLANLFLLLFLLLPFRIPAQPIVNPIKTPIRDSSVRIITRKFAQLPPFRRRPQRIVSMTPLGPDLYVLNNLNAHIYRVNRTGNPTLWFDLAAAVLAQTARPVDFSKFLHGGLRSLAFHPDYSRNRLIYTAYMELRPNNTRSLFYLSDARQPIVADSVVAEWRVSTITGKPDPTSFRPLFRIGMSKYDHTIREMRFLANYLYIAHGDGSEQNRTLGGGQRNDALGKILRIDPLRRRRAPYTVPRSNPFVNNSTYLDEIFALGFRNPHNICFSKSGELFAVDVGRDNVEEIDIVKAGGNYGWSEREGTFRHLEGDGGILTGIAPLPENDASFGFIYPNAQVGHFGERGAGFVFQGLTGSCPIENGSQLDGLMLYANFPDDGQMYFSTLDALRAAVVQGNPDDLTQATTFAPRVWFEKADGRLVRVKNLRAIVRMDPEFREVQRVDARFGQGSGGEIYWSSKQNGALYLITNSVRKQG